jgi:hypothetical protein
MNALHGPGGSLSPLAWLVGLALAAGAIVSGQPGQRASNVCRCEPPINSKARGPGACTRTQDGATFCEIVFPSERTAREATQGPLFGKAGLKMPPDEVSQAAGRLENGQGGTTSEILRSIQVAMLVSANARPEDQKTQDRFRDLLALTSREGSGLPVPQLADALGRYASEPEGAAETPLVQRGLAASPGSRTFDVWSTRGCLAFADQPFVFLLRRTARAADCSPRRG